MEIPIADAGIIILRMRGGYAQKRRPRGEEQSRCRRGDAQQRFFRFTHIKSSRKSIYY